MLLHPLLCIVYVIVCVYQITTRYRCITSCAHMCTVCRSGCVKYSAAVVLEQGLCWDSLFRMAAAGAGNPWKGCCWPDPVSLFLSKAVSAALHVLCRHPGWVVILPHFCASDQQQTQALKSLRVVSSRPAEGLCVDSRPAFQCVFALVLTLIIWKSPPLGWKAYFEFLLAGVRCLDKGHDLLIPAPKAYSLGTEA